MGGVQERIDAQGTWVTWVGPPFVDPTSGRRGAFVEECMALNEAELEELCSYYEWRTEQVTTEIDVWWCWTVVRFGRRLLEMRRGHTRHPRLLP
ncbi:hypothetical protein [Phycicoccus sp. 3266]|uniref:hypothetical protein n=1 Tax=Phycicoccus sp. 3266 TaxID=2817751 RepID=UPI0028639352|nr:hypothetical protein [Phycicoccus sp. 3266]MDR6865264.1 hypothetical protein [Phycicoccus sp. 3266]